MSRTTKLVRDLSRRKWVRVLVPPAPAWPKTTWELAFIWEPRDLWVGLYVDRPRRYALDDWYWSGPDQSNRFQVGGLTSVYMMILTVGFRLRIRWRDRPYPNDPME